MGIIGGFILAIIGMIYNWWNGDVGVMIYVFSFIISIIYCYKYNGSEWAV